MAKEEKIIKMPPVTFLKVDEMIQRILGILILLTLIVYPIAMLLLIPFGAWQVISGSIGALYGSRWRIKYLGIVVAYFSIYYFSDSLENHYGLNEFIGMILMVIYLITPVVLGLGYYAKTWQEFLARKDEGIKLKLEDMDDVLDIDMIS